MGYNHQERTEVRHGRAKAVRNHSGVGAADCWAAHWLYLEEEYQRQDPLLPSVDREREKAQQIPAGRRDGTPPRADRTEEIPAGGTEETAGWNAKTAAAEVGI